MSTSAQSYDEADDDSAPAKRVRMPRRASARTAKTSARASRLPQKTMLVIAFWGAIIGGLLTCISLYRHGHAASWRSIAMIAAHTVPLFIGLWLVQIITGISRRFTQSLAVGLCVTVILTIGIMILLPSVALYGSTYLSPVADDVETSETLLHDIMGFAAMGYLYLATGFRYWWPFGLLLPLYMGFWHWRSRRL